MLLAEFIDVLEILPARRTNKGERDGSKCHVEQTPPFWRRDVVFPLRDGGCDDLDLPLVKADPFVEFAGSGFTRGAIRQAYLGRTAFLEHVDNTGLLGIRDRLCGENDGAVGLSQDLEPFPDLVTERCVAEHQPGLIKDDQAWVPGQAHLDPAEEIEKDGDEIALAHIHEFLDLEGLEHPKRQPVLLGIEELSHRTVDRVMVKRGLDLAHLNAAHEIRERSAAGLGHQGDLTGDRVAVIGCDGDSLHGNKRFDPLGCPCPVPVGRKLGQRAECERTLPCPDLVVIAAGGFGQRVERLAFIKGEDLRRFVPAELCRDQRQQGRLSRPRRPEDQRMADIVDMQVQPEGRRAAGDLHQRRGIGRIERAWGGRAARPYGIDRNEVGEIACVYERFANIGVGIAGQAAEIGLGGIECLDPGAKAFGLDQPPDCLRLTA